MRQPLKPPFTRALFFCIALSAVILFLNYSEYSGLAFLNETKHLLAVTTFWKTAFYIISYLLVATSYLILLLNHARLPWIIFLVLNAIALSTHFVFQQINGYGLKFMEMRLILTEYKFAGDAFGNFHSMIAWGILKGIICSGALVLLRLIPLRLNKIWLGIVPLAFLMTYSAFYKTNSSRDVYPLSFKLPILAAMVEWGAGNQMYFGPKDPVKIEPATKGAQKIVFLIDESIRADFLTINNPKIPTTPFLFSIQNELKNLGVATSSSNCSVDSNTILRTGIQLHQLPDSNGLALKLPSLFQYARAAGYRTYYLDGQDDFPGQLQNNLGKYDLEFIDEYIYIKGNGIPLHQVDPEIAEKIQNILAKDEKSFVIANKEGAHFIYNKRYPPQEDVFKVSLISHEPDPLQKTIHSYANAVRWNVDLFFKKLYPRLKQTEDLALIYTSDHGASFGGTGDHCTTVNMPNEQVTVPLFLFGKSAMKHFQKQKIHPNTSSHFFVFPSLLVFMGYDETSVTTNYGPTLWSGKMRKKTFANGDMFGRGGQFHFGESGYQPAALPYDLEYVRRESRRQILPKD